MSFELMDDARIDLRRVQIQIRSMTTLIELWNDQDEERLFWRADQRLRVGVTEQAALTRRFDRWPSYGALHASSLPSSDASLTLKSKQRLLCRQHSVHQLLSTGFTFAEKFIFTLYEVRSTFATGPNASALIYILIGARRSDTADKRTVVCAYHWTV